MGYAVRLVLLISTLLLLEVFGVRATHLFTPSSRKSMNLRAEAASTKKPQRFEESSQEPSGFAVEMGKTTTASIDTVGTRLQTATDANFPSKRQTTADNLQPKSENIQKGRITEKPNVTFLTKTDTNSTLGSNGLVTTMPEGSNKSFSVSETYHTFQSVHRNHTLVTTTEESKTVPTKEEWTTPTWLTVTPPLSSDTSSGHADQATTTSGGVSAPPYHTPKRTTVISTRRSTHPVKKNTPSTAAQSPETHGIVAAVLIGLILLMMFVGIIVIMINKRKWQRRQLETSDWAGPSPFLDGSTQPNFTRFGESSKRESKRISIVGFLPQQSSKHQSLIQDLDDDLDMVVLSGTTFGQSTANDTKPANGTSAEQKEEGGDKQHHENIQPAAGSPPQANNVANHSPNTDTVVSNGEDGMASDLKEVPLENTSTTTTSTDIPLSSPETSDQGENQLTAIPALQIPSAPQIPGP